MNGISNGTDANDDEKENDNNSQPSTSRPINMETPKWNMSTRQLYEDNLKSTNMAPQKSVCQPHLRRERAPSTTESTSSDDSCVYRYKGDSENRNRNDLNKVRNCSSPEMDYLEMDFDPCQSNGHESSDGSYSCENVDLEKDRSGNEVVDNTSEECASTPINFDERLLSTSSWVEEINHDNLEPVPSTSNFQNSDKTKSTVKNLNISRKLDTLESNSVGEMNERVESDEELEFLQKTVLMKHIAEATGNSCCISSILQALFSLNGMETSIIEEELRNKIVLNSNLELDIPIVDYLHSVSKGSLTVFEMMPTIEKLFDGCITSRFFFTQPHRKINLSSWLLNWMKKDVVPILSMNFHLTEDDCGNSVNASWHFQVVRAVGHKVIHLFSHVDCVSEDLILKLLSNPSEVLVSRDEVITRWTPESDLSQLMTPSDYLWKKYNVLGQVVNVIREGVTGKSEDEMKHVKIPSPHRTGILLLIRTDNPNRRELMEASDLPLFDEL